MRTRLIAELATNWAGDPALLVDLIHAAADAGADLVKTQSYQVRHLKRSDPQYDWLQRCELTDPLHELAQETCAKVGVEWLTTVFHPERLSFLSSLGLKSVKVGSGEARTDLVYQAREAGFHVCVSLPWGEGARDEGVTYLATVPLYPMPPECYSRVRSCVGWSDHAEGLSVAKLAIAQGANVVEKHFSFRDRGRWQAWNMDSPMLRELREWAEACAVMTRGTRYEERWTTKTA